MKKLLIGTLFFIPFLMAAQNSNKNTEKTIVKWLSFKCENIGEHVQLNWRTVSEINNSGFDIERSTNNQNFTKIGFVKGSGNSVIIQKYTFLDGLFNFNNIDPFTDKLYYRLKQIDYDGNVHFSKTISVSTPNVFSLNIYPNPFTTNLSLYINTPIFNQLCSVQVLAITGMLILEKNYTLNSNQSTIDLSELKSLNPGVYFIKVTIRNKTIISKIIKEN